MNVSDFTYDLPERLIAQEPATQRDEARLMVVHRAEKRLEHRRVRDLPEYLRAGDVMVLNDTRVIAARLLGVKEGTGGQVELLLLEPLANPSEWEVLLRASRRPAPGARMFFGGGMLCAVMLEEGEKGRARVRFESQKPLYEVLDDVGLTPLPPYIHRKNAEQMQSARDRDRYQTIYARHPGAVAAPTAGLHFTPALFDRLDKAGVERVYVTLHVGIGTFRPVSVEHVEAHVMDEERYHFPAETAESLNACRARGGRIVGVGSTSVRTLESVMARHQRLTPDEGRTDLFIYPPYTFRAVDAMLTNFHLPRSTLLMMVCALAGSEFMLEAYREAVREEYRFFSYGDAMLIL
jgi:S-adenosylmethionine:tRNA ribosyltransferase-isomerase